MNANEYLSPANVMAGISANTILIMTNEGDHKNVTSKACSIGIMCELLLFVMQFLRESGFVIKL